MGILDGGEFTTLAKNSGVDLFKYSTPDGRSIRKGLDYLLPFANKEQVWKEVQLKEFNYDMPAQLSRHAEVVYKDPKILKIYQKFYDSDQSSDRNILQYGFVSF